MFPQWFLDQLVCDEDRNKAISGELKDSDFVTLKCFLHGEFKLGVKTVRDNIKHNNKSMCPLCSLIEKGHNSLVSKFSNGRGLYPLWFIDRLVSEGDKVRAREGRISARDKLYFKCDIHGVYRQFVGAHLILSLNGNPCPLCNTFSRISVTYEEEVKNYIESLYSGKIIYSYKASDIPIVEYSIFLPDLGVAINLVKTYYSCISNVVSPYNCNYNRDAFKFSLNKGIHLISLFEYDWNTKKNKIKRYLKRVICGGSILNLDDLHICRLIDKSIILKFCRVNYLGTFHKKMDICYGVCNGSELVSLVTFSFCGNGVYRIINYCTKIGLELNGLSLIIDRFIKDVNPAVIYGSSNNDFYTGSDYELSGFTFDKYVRPLDFWTDGSRIITARIVRSYKVKESYPDLYCQAKEFGLPSESYVMGSLGFYKFYRSGSRKWVLNLREVE